MKKIKKFKKSVDHIKIRWYSSTCPREDSKNFEN